jgi:hypothetical protein
MSQAARLARHAFSLLEKPQDFTLFSGGIELRPYQLPAFGAIIRSVQEKAGGTFVIKFSRQAGKDELLAQLIVYLLAVLQHRDASIIMASPTFKPQTENAMTRLEARLESNAIMRYLKWHRHGGYIFRVRNARALYFSAETSASVVGATASHLLIMNEAQDIAPAVYDKRFAPMAAAHNATQVFAGTAWTRDSLLERQQAYAEELQKQDGRQRVFIADAETVAVSSPEYDEFFRKEVERLGRQHPLIKTQYFCETLDDEASLFSQTMLDAIPAAEPYSGSGPTAFLIDVAGQAEASTDPEAYGGGTEGRRDSTTLTICRLDLATLATLQAPTYHITARHRWTGSNHLEIFGQIKALAEGMRPLHIVMDATGVGEGLWAMLDRAFPEKVMPVKFSLAKKSDLAWRFMAILSTGRLRDHAHTAEVARQYRHARSELLPGPAKRIRWGVPDGARDADGRPVHDDYLMADALMAELDALPWAVEVHTPTLIVPAADPLDEMGSNF